MAKTPKKTERDGDRPLHKWSAQISELGTPRLALHAPLVVTLEDYGEEVVASYPEVEAFGSGATEFDALDALKDEIAGLYEELAVTPDEKLGKLPKRWRRTLLTVAHPV